TRHASAEPRTEPAIRSTTTDHICAVLCASDEHRSCHSVRALWVSVDHGAGCSTGTSVRCWLEAAHGSFSSSILVRFPLAVERGEPGAGAGWVVLCARGGCQGLASEVAPGVMTGAQPLGGEKIRAGAASKDRGVVAVPGGRRPSEG